MRWNAVIEDYKEFKSVGTYENLFARRKDLLLQRETCVEVIRGARV